MAQIAVGAAIGAGFGVIRRTPLSVLAWGALPAILQALAIALLAPMYLTMFGAIANAARSGSTAPPDMTAFQGQVMATSGLVQLLNLCQLLISAVIYCAVFRAVLHPEKSSYVYMRLGGPELFLVVMIFAALMATVIGVLLVILPVSIIVALVAAASHGGGAAIALLLPILVLAVFVAIVYLALRFALVGPMMVDDGKFHFVESWRLTRGRVGSLFLIALGLIGLGLALDLVLLVVVLSLGVGALGAVAGGLQNLPALFQQPPQAVLSRLTPFLGVYFVLSIPLAGCIVAIFGAPWARAYQDLRPDAAEAFA